MDTKEHWERVYGTKAPDQVSWFRAHLETSLALIERAAGDRSASIIDVGGGTSSLVDDLVAVGQREGRADMIQQKLPGAAEVTFTDEMSINLGGKEVVARHFSPGHTNGDVVVYFPALRVVSMVSSVAVTWISSVGYLDATMIYLIPRG